MGIPSGKTGLEKLRAVWNADPKGVSLDLLRIGTGLIWALNLLFILDPANLYFPTFRAVAESYASQTLGGPAISNFVAAHALPFAWLIAIATAYLAVAFFLGITTRLASLVGLVSSVFYFLTQFYMTFMIPGGTDVGAHPLYLLLYLVLFIGGAGKYLSADSLLWVGETRFPRLTRWFFTPPPSPLPPREGTSAPVVKGPSPTSRARRRFTLWSLLAVASFSLLLVGAGLAERASEAPLAPVPTKVNIVDIQYHLAYPGGASTGGFGPSYQDGCFICAQHVPPGSVAQEELMLTNNQSTTTQTIESLSVSAPFTLVSGPPLPSSVPAGDMWMPIVELGTPQVPGNYVVYVNFTVT